MDLVQVIHFNFTNWLANSRNINGPKLLDIDMSIDVQTISLGRRDVDSKGPGFMIWQNWGHDDCSASGIDEIVLQDNARPFFFGFCSTGWLKVDPANVQLL